MPGVAIHGSTITTVTKPNHVSYSIETWQQTSCAFYDLETGLCNSWNHDWVPSGSGSTGARITGTVSVASSKLRIEGASVASVGDTTIESWVADPPIPSSSATTRYIANGPTSGSGTGSITSGSSKGKIAGKAIALIGSQVTTHLGTITTIENGSNQMNFSS